MRLVFKPTIISAWSTAPHLDNDEFREYIGEERAADARMTSHGDFVPETSGRLCYQSFSKPRPGGNAAYLERILSEGHGCYDEETEVLTDHGWVKFPDVESLPQDTKFATIDEYGVIEYQKSTGRVSAWHSGDMYYVNSRGVDLLVTPNHRMYICPTTTKRGRCKVDFEFVRADEAGRRSHCYRKSGHWACPPGEQFSWISRDLMKLLGMSIGDGYFDGKNRISFNLKKERKINEVKRLSESCGARVHVETDGKLSVRFNVGSRESALLSGIYNERKEKVIPQGLITGCSRDQLEGLMEGLIETDGHIGKTGVSYDTTSSFLAGQFQALALHVGLAANVCYVVDESRRISGGSFGRKPLIRLSLISNGLKPEIKEPDIHGRKYGKIENWAGHVYCVEVPNGTLYVKRSGKPVWCGNSVLEHATIGFIIHGVSRSLTHELIRHKAGTAVSELSQRFVDASDLGFVVPPKYVDCRQVVKVFTKAVRDALDYYIVLCDEEAADTLTRKRIRESARSVLPNCVETHIAFSGNLRAWRNILEQRGNIHADLEIRRLAVALLEPLKLYAPNVFQDFDIVKDEDGRESVVNKWRKV